MDRTKNLSRIKLAMPALSADGARRAADRPAGYMGSRTASALAPALTHHRAPRALYG